MRRLSISLLTPAACLSLFGCADDSAAGPVGTEGDKSDTETTSSTAETGSTTADSGSTTGELGSTTGETGSTTGDSEGSGVMFRGLGDLPGGEYFSEAADVSGDGMVIVGYSVSRAPSQGVEVATEAVRWIDADPVPLGDIDGALFSEPQAVSGDGLVAVGYELAFDQAWRALTLHPGQSSAPAGRRGSHGLALSRAPLPLRISSSRFRLENTRRRQPGAEP